MKKWYCTVFLSFCLLLAGCGGGDNGLPANYVGLFKSYRSSNDTKILVTISSDNGTEYEGTIMTVPVKGKWGEQGGDQLGLIAHQLDKGIDTNFLNFYLSIAGSVISGAALRQ